MVDSPEVKNSAAAFASQPGEPSPDHGLLRFLDAQFALDARSLALVRMAIATLLLYDLGLRATDLSAHYTDLGVWPRSILQLRPWSFAWSLHALGGSPGYEAALFGLGAAAGAALLLGWQTRIATLASFVLALSLQARNPFLHDGQDDLLRLLLFWSLWLPLGRRWSLDALREPQGREPRGRERPNRVGGLHAVGLAGQFLLIYESSALGKLQSGWWTSGHGILHALQLGRYETFAGRWAALHLSGPLTALNFPVIGLEAALPLLLWVPWRRDQVRTAAVALAIALHASFGIFLRLSIFPALSIAGWLLFLPATVWARGKASTPERPDRPALRGNPAIWAVPFLLAELLYVGGTHLGQPLLPDPARRAVEAVGLQQYWVVFSPPDPSSVTDGYFVADGREADGSQVDLFKPDEQLTWEPPPLVSASFRNSRWRHFYANLVVDWARGSDQWRDMLEVREATAKWMCREHRARHPEAPALQRVSLYFVEHFVERPEEVPRRRLLTQVACLGQ